MQSKMGGRGSDVKGAVLALSHFILAGALVTWERTSAHCWKDDGDPDGFPQLCSYSSLPLDVALRVRITKCSSPRSYHPKTRTLKLTLPLRMTTLIGRTYTHPTTKLKGCGEGGK